MPRKPKALTELAPDLVREVCGWDPAVPLTTAALVRWMCSAGHEYEALIGNRVRLGSGCPFCAGKKPIIGETDFASRFPDLALEADGWNPTDYTYGSGLVVAWKCSRGHRWNAQINSRGRGVGCPGCAGQMLIQGHNDLQTRFPELAKEAFGWDPSQVFSKSNRKLQWKCPLGHVFVAMPADRAAGNGCSICAGKTILVGFNDLATLLPAVAIQADGWDPTTVTVSSGKRLSWICSLGHRWNSTVAGRRKKPNCPTCSNKKLLAGFNDLATTHPELAREAFGWNPKEVIAGSNVRRAWRCPLGHEYECAPNTRTRGDGCPFCSNHRVLRGFNDLATTHPILASEADGWDPTTVIAGTHKKLSWKCQSGHQWKAACNSRAQGVGCPPCASSGYDPNKKAWLYLIENDFLDMLQVGITNDAKRRLAEHKKRSWTAFDIRGPMDGVLTYEWEQAILTFLRNQGVQLGPDSQHGKFDGYTESWRKSDFIIDSLKTLMDLVDLSEAIQTP